MILQNILIPITTFITSTAVLYFIIGYSLPFSFFVDVKGVEWGEICVGDTMQTVTATRDARWTTPATGYGEVVRLTDDLRLETTIRRGSESDPLTFTYESNIQQATYEVAWVRYTNDDAVVFTEPGLYGSQDTITIYPMPLIKITEVFPAEENLFKVVDCDNEKHN